MLIPQSLRLLSLDLCAVDAIYFLLVFVFVHGVCVDGARPWDPLGNVLELANELDSLEIVICLICHSFSILREELCLFVLLQLPLGLVGFSPFNDIGNSLLSFHCLPGLGPRTPLTLDNSLIFRFLIEAA